jgi:hypothetical protein
MDERLRPPGGFLMDLDEIADLLYDGTWDLDPRPPRGRLLVEILSVLLFLILFGAAFVLFVYIAGLT